MGIDRCEVMHDSAWLRRMNVSHKYQRKGIGTALLNEAIKFCQNKGVYYYTIIKLIIIKVYKCQNFFYFFYTFNGLLVFQDMRH